MELHGMPWLQDQLPAVWQRHKPCEGPEHSFLLSITSEHCFHDAYQSEHHDY